MKRIWRLLVLVLIVAALAVVARLTPLGRLVTQLPAVAGRPWAPAAFIGAYAAATMAQVPGSLLSLAGGAAFGLGGGLLLNLAGATLGSAGAFLLGRAVGGRVQSPRLAGLEQPKSALVATLRLRLIPFMPFAATSYAAGMTRAPLRAFLGGTLLGILPSALIYTYTADALARGTLTPQQAAVRVAIALGGLLVLSLLPTLVRRLRRRIAT